MCFTFNNVAPESSIKLGVMREELLLAVSNFAILVVLVLFFEKHLLVKRPDFLHILHNFLVLHSAVSCISVTVFIQC